MRSSRVRTLDEGTLSSSPICTLSATTRMTATTKSSLNSKRQHEESSQEWARTQSLIHLCSTPSLNEETSTSCWNWRSGRTATTDTFGLTRTPKATCTGFTSRYRTWRQGRPSRWWYRISQNTRGCSSKDSSRASSHCRSIRPRKCDGIVQERISNIPVSLGGDGSSTHSNSNIRFSSTTTLFGSPLLSRIVTRCCENTSSALKNKLSRAIIVIRSKYRWRFLIMIAKAT